MYFTRKVKKILMMHTRWWNGGCIGGFLEGKTLFWNCSNKKSFKIECSSQRCLFEPIFENRFQKIRSVIDFHITCEWFNDSTFGDIRLNSIWYRPNLRPKCYFQLTLKWQIKMVHPTLNSGHPDLHFGKCPLEPCFVPFAVLNLDLCLFNPDLR